MKNLMIIFFSLFMLQSFGQTKTVNDPNAKVRQISSDFKAVSVATGIELFLTQGDEVSLAVSANEEKYEAHFKTEVANGVLNIYYDNSKMNNWEKGRKLKAYLSVKSISKLVASSGASVELTNSLKLEKLDMRLSSGAELKGDVKINALEVDQSSGSTIRISGVATSIEINASSGSVFKGYDLVTESCDASASSGADIKITSNKEISASASSGGSIMYKGGASEKDISKSSGGSVKKS